MIKTIMTGLWACVIALLASFFAAQWKADIRPAPEGAHLEALETHKLEPLTVPMINDGTVEGYVLARLVFTANTGAVHKLSVDPAPFVTDEAFREIYNNGKIEFGQIAKYNLDKMVENIKDSVNRRLGPEVIDSILVEEINYAEHSDVRS
ncbi:hypothetical protein [Afifella sp. IM 167]|uniref:hypothetical protein n=1 Tax=Afifella sp. IM 167 TaxID=2033586 RepID=UPI001CCED7A5|nr:hypothetical protein [Afifella sp. IM 167]MBZ8131809.1 hypothetical protein [Afifella sp. IM 167]